MSSRSRLAVFSAVLVAGCTGSPSPSALDAGASPDAGRVRVEVVEGTCLTAGNDAGATESLKTIGCRADFQALASAPIDATLPGARSVKVVFDQADSALYFQNSVLFPVHYDFVSTHLSGGGRPVVPKLAEFNATEYYSPERRFILGAATHYDGPDEWVLELSPYDTASAAMITTLFQAVKAAAYFGPALAFHPTSEAVAVEAGKLSGISVVTTDELYAATDYQPLNLATGVGRLRFVTAAALATQEVSYEDLLVLDEAPNDISVVQGLVTEEFQTPLSHVNVLSRNRKTPNMGLRGAMSNPVLKALEGKLVELTVGALEWSVREVGVAEAQAFWTAHKPAPLTLPPMDLLVTGLVDLEDVTPEPAAGGSLREAIKTAVAAFGGKAAQYSVLTRTAGVPTRKAFAVPISAYDAFMRENGLYTRLEALLADPSFASDSAVRKAKLTEFREAMMAGVVDASLQEALKAKIAADYPGATKMRFRTSTNSEDLEGFPCAGCYESQSGKVADWEDVLDAIRETWASAWLFRTFEERSYYGVDHKSVGMALLVHRNFPEEEANGVAVTANPFDAAGVDPAFYVNVQFGGEAEVVAPPAGVTSDQLLYFFSEPNQPTTYLTHSSLVTAGTTVLTGKQLFSLGTALKAIHERFSAAYGPAAGNTGWYAMDVEFKFDDEDAPGEPPTLYVKQARPYPK